MKYERTTTASRRAAKKPPRYIHEHRIAITHAGPRLVTETYITEEGKARMLANQYRY